ncbi:MAG: PhoU domain-containing protein [Halodesulfurarchaeum sp.]
MTRKDDGPIERKVQVAGGSTFTLSLPREWGVRHGLSKGETVYLYPEQDRCVVAPSTVDTDATTTRITAADSEWAGLVQQIKGAYTDGSEKVIVEGDGVLDDELVKRVTNTVEGFIGMEVQSVSDAEIVIMDHLDPDTVSTPQSIGLMHHLAVEMHHDAVAAVRTNEETLARIVHERDDHVDRLFAFVSRCLNRVLIDIGELGRLDVSRRHAFHYYKIARELERVADKAERITDVALDQSTIPSEELGEQFEELVRTATEVVTLALNDETDSALKTHRAVVDLLDSLDRQLATREDPDAYRYGRDLVESARRTSSYGLNIVNMTLEVSVGESQVPSRWNLERPSRSTGQFG